MERSFGTHDGTFHADEVTACALLLVFDRIDREKIFRTRDEKMLQACEYVCDVGGVYDEVRKRFDHHQMSYAGEMSSAGMVWKYLRGQGSVDQKLYDFVNRSFLWGVDAHDNGKVALEVGVCTFSLVVTNFVPPTYEATEEQQTAAFFKALDFVCGHVTRLLERYRYIETCRALVAKAMEGNRRYLLFDRAMPWLDLFFDMGGEGHPALFVLMPSGEHWKLRAIPPSSRERMGMRKPLPKEWAGLMGQELEKASGIEGAIFCHKGRFISVWKTKEGAMKALEYVLR